MPAFFFRLFIRKIRGAVFLSFSCLPALASRPRVPKRVHFDSCGRRHFCDEKFCGDVERLYSVFSH